MDNKKIIKEKLEKIKRPFPAELPGTDTKIDFVTEDDRIVGQAMQYLRGEKLSKVAEVNNDLRRAIIDYLPKDGYAEKVHDDNISLLNDLDEIVGLLNKSIE